jgi:meso-butanediol dehydrogenase / (S,S)-butanediol dehydrogenase / diacetyl reductase
MTPAPLQDKVAFVTGAAAGIGRAIAQEWAMRGGTVFITDVDEAGARGVAQEIDGRGGRAMHRKMDVCHAGEIKSAIGDAIGAFGRIDALFNVAGVNLAKNVEECDDDEWDRIVDTNLTSVYRCAKFTIPEMKKRGGGSIVNIASIAGVLAENRCAAYSASKAGVILLTKNMALDFAKDGIRVNVVCPAGALTPRTSGYFDKAPELKREIAALRPMNRFAEPEEIARPAIFLASPDASYITGATLMVDGGLTAGFRSPIFDRL